MDIYSKRESRGKARKQRIPLPALRDSGITSFSSGGGCEFKNLWTEWTEWTPVVHLMKRYIFQSVTM